MPRRGIYSAVLLAILLAQPSKAENEVPEDPLPKLQRTACGPVCLNYQPAKPLLHELPKFRSDRISVSGFAPEGFAYLSYVIGTDGKTHDITPIYRLGSPEITERAIEAVKAWTFEPATQDGKPVAQTQMFQARFVAANINPMRPAIQSLYQQANRLFESGKAEDARALLEKAVSAGRLSFFERSTLALPLIRLAMQRKDYLEARRYAVMATMPGHIPAELAERLWEARVASDLALGELGDAVKALDDMVGLAGFNPDGPLAGMTRDALAKAAAMPELTTRAAIPAGDAVPVYWHALYRNTFKFAVGDGTLSKFTLSCDRNMMESAVSFTAQWRLPDQWRNCAIFVSGSPGANFGIIEIKDGEQQDADVRSHLDYVLQVGRGQAALRANRPQDAAAAFTTAAAMIPEKADAYLGRASAYHQMGNIAPGLADAERVVTALPTNRPARSWRGLLLLASGRCQEALKDFNMLLPSDDGNIHYWRGLAYFCLAKYPEAAGGFGAASLRFMGGDPASLLRVRNLLQVARMKQAHEDGAMFTNPQIGLAPEDWNMQIADLYRGRRSLQEVETVMQAARNDPAGTKKWPCAADFFLGEYKLAKGDKTGARASLAQAAPANCRELEASAAAAELARLDAN